MGKNERNKRIIQKTINFIMKTSLFLIITNYRRYFCVDKIQIFIHRFNNASIILFSSSFCNNRVCLSSPSCMFYYCIKEGKIIDFAFNFLFEFNLDSVDSFLCFVSINLWSSKREKKTEVEKRNLIKTQKTFSSKK